MFVHGMKTDRDGFVILTCSKDKDSEQSEVAAEQSHVEVIRQQHGRVCTRYTNKEAADWLQEMLDKQAKKAAVKLPVSSKKIKLVPAPEKPDYSEEDRRFSAWA